MKIKDMISLQGINVNDYKVALKKKFIRDQKKKKRSTFPLDTISQVRNSLSKDMP